MVIFEQCKQELSLSGSGLRPLCPTRWTVRNVAIEAVVRNYSALLEAFEVIGRESHDDYDRRATGVLAMLEKFSVFFGLKLSYLVFGATEQVSHALQAKDTTVQEALSSAKMAEAFVQRQRSNDAFDRFYDSTVIEAQNYTMVPVLPRYRRPPRRLDDGADPYAFTTPKDYYRRQYFEVLDFIKEELSRRFDQKSLALPKAVKQLLLNASQDSDDMAISIPDVIVNAYSRDIDIAKLKRQLLMLPDLIKSYQSSQSLAKLHVTSIRTLANILLAVPWQKKMFSELDKLLKIYFTIPITTATSERSFSVLRRVKTYLCSTMSEARLNNVMLLHTHKDLTDSIDINKIADTFVLANSR